MQALARAARGILPATAAAPAARVQQARGIVVHVKDGNLERALGVMARKMRSSGIERLIRARSQIHHHVKDSEKRVLARKALMQRVRSQELGKKLRDILIKKIRLYQISILKKSTKPSTRNRCPYLLQFLVYTSELAS
ncbi:hypothetical protein OsJ_12197 [Oryza sativa Japonica Group]|uniref:Uncharacterized protein n=1 Tax=Oryza sativa subsp. japonica TaxID=39947 RepID=Q851K6_ORYSJ|nr:hypothetical protein [Oryza sativa Japonica Group]EAZ28227.1 hypothetical protein OsJ_12197 [Oryza sativa Japonica Group]